MVQDPVHSLTPHCRDKETKPIRILKLNIHIRTANSVNSVNRRAGIPVAEGGETHSSRDKSHSHGESGGSAQQQSKHTGYTHRKKLRKKKDSQTLRWLLFSGQHVRFIYDNVGGIPALASSLKQYQNLQTHRKTERARICQ